MPTAPEVVSAFDDVSPRTGAVGYGDYTNDNSPLIRVALGDQAAVGQTLTVASDQGQVSAPMTLTAGEVAQGYADVPLSGLSEGFNLLSASLRRTDGSSFVSTTSFALGVATGQRATPAITSALDDVGPVTGALADGDRTDDATPSFRIFEAGLPPAPEGPPGHAPYGGPPLLGGHVQLYEGGHLMGDAMIGYDGVVTLTSDVLAPGDHVLTAVAIDRAGNVSPPSSPFHLEVDLPVGGAANHPTNGDDVLRATGAFAEINGGPGADTIAGEASSALLRGGPGDDSIVGGGSFDAINGNQGDDSIVGRSTVGDWLLGGQGDDLIDARGSSGLNIVNGNQGDDSVFGGSGGGILRGGQGNDVVSGGGGADWIFGDMGDNTVTGGAGADTFLAIPGRHTDHVLDFNQAEGDRVLVLAGGYQAAQVGADTVVTVAGQGQIILVGVAYANLQDGWIVTA